MADSLVVRKLIQHCKTPILQFLKKEMNITRENILKIKTPLIEGEFKKKTILSAYHLPNDRDKTYILSHSPFPRKLVCVLSSFPLCLVFRGLS